MNFEEYQREAGKTAVYGKNLNTWQERLDYVTLGLASESGEVAGKVKKLLRGDVSIINQNKDLPDYFEYRYQIADEAGDALWYISRIAEELGIPLEIIAQRNIDKLKSRQERDVIKGSGDNR